MDADWYYLLRTYDTRLASNVTVLDAYLRDAFMPAVKRQGIDTVGVFDGWFGDQSLGGKYLVLGSDSLDLLVNLERELASDEEHEQAGHAFLTAEVGESAFIRVKSSLLRAVPGLPRLHTPRELAGQANRLFELRTYEQPSQGAHARKLDMFMEVEHELLRRAGFEAVMYGSDLVGERLPRLTYMWCYPDLGSRQLAEQAFFSAPETMALFQEPRWRISSAIANTILRPTSYSDL